MPEEQEPSGENQNLQLVLISGKSASGKSASLANLPNKERWIYCNCESGKRPPFRGRFFGDGPSGSVIVDPYQVWEAIDYAKDETSIDGVIIDTATFLMDMFETKYVLALGKSKSMEGWSNYAQFWKTLMLDKVASLGKPCIILGHTRDDLNEKTMEMETAVPVKGALKNNGIEAYFSTVVSTKKVSIKDLAGMDPELLHITEEEEAVGFKHVFQTRITKDTLGERIRSPMGLFTPKQTYIDNDAQLLLNHLREYYGE